MFKKKCKRNTLAYTVDGLTNKGGGGGGGVISGIIYSLASGWTYIRGP